MAFGYIGVEPTNDKSSNNGVFDITAINKLRKDENLSSEGFNVDYLIAGGGGGGINGLGTGGGGSGAVITTTGNNGGGSSNEPQFRAYVGKAYEVVIGAGASSGGNTGGITQFHDIFAFPGGTGASQNSDSYSGGGAGRFSGTSNRDQVYADQFGGEGNDIFKALTGHNTQGTTTGGNASYNAGKAGGGGAGGGGSSGGGTGGVGIINNNFLSTSEASTESVGEVVSSNVYWGGGGAGGDYDSNVTQSGGNGGGGNTSQSGSANTGGGGGGSGNNSGHSGGGSGVILLKYPDTYTITDNTGLTLGTTYTAGGFSVTPIKSGDGSLTWGKA